MNAASRVRNRMTGRPAGFASAFAAMALVVGSGVATGCSDATQGAGAGEEVLFATDDAAGGADSASTQDAAGDGRADAGPDPGADAGPDSGPDGAPDSGPDGEADAAGTFDYPCVPLSTRACVTSCASAGTSRCLKDWGPCIPPEEFCGNCVDDDCDGLVNEQCPPNPECEPVTGPGCATPVIEVTEGGQLGTGTVVHLSAAASSAPSGAAITTWAWSVSAPPGSAATFAPSDAVESPTFTVDLAGQYLFSLEVWDADGGESCGPAQAAVAVVPQPPVLPAVGCADGEREGFLSLDTYTHVAACSGAWQEPGITPDTVVPMCGRQGGDDGPKADGAGCSAADLCAEGWHLCSTWHELAEKSPTGCAGATPPDAKPKSLLFALRQPSETGSVCGDWGDGFNDVFGCGNLGTALTPDKGCGPLDRVMASTQPQSCGFNEAEPGLGPWECKGDAESHLHEGALVTKDACQDQSCSYDGYPVGPADKGGVLCCRD